jgi:hypothetical protein
LATDWLRKVRVLRRQQGTPAGNRKARRQIRWQVKKLDRRIEANLWQFVSELRYRTRKWYGRLAAMFDEYVYSPESLRKKIERRLEPIRTLTGERLDTPPLEKALKLLRDQILRNRAAMKTKRRAITAVYSRE